MQAPWTRSINPAKGWMLNYKGKTTRWQYTDTSPQHEADLLIHPKLQTRRTYKSGGKRGAKMHFKHIGLIFERMNFHLFSDRQSIMENSFRSSHCASSYPSVADSILVSTTTPLISAKTNFTTKFSKPINQSSTGKSSSGSEQKPAVGGLDCFRKKLQAEGISQKKCQPYHSL